MPKIDVATKRSCLADRAASSQRHWHWHEDEFVYVLEGERALIEDGGPALLRAGHVHARGKQVGQIVGNAHMVEHVDRRVRLKFDQNVYIARDAALAPRKRAEQRRVAHSAGAKFALMIA